MNHRLRFPRGRLFSILYSLLHKSPVCFRTHLFYYINNNERKTNKASLFFFSLAPSLSLSLSFSSFLCSRVLHEGEWLNKQNESIFPLIRTDRCIRRQRERKPDLFIRTRGGNLFLITATTDRCSVIELHCSIRLDRALSEVMLTRKKNESWSERKWLALFSLSLSLLLSFFSMNPRAKLHEHSNQLLFTFLVKLHATYTHTDRKWHWPDFFPLWENEEKRSFFLCFFSTSHTFWWKRDREGDCKVQKEMLVTWTNRVSIDSILIIFLCQSSASLRWWSITFNSSL